MNQNTHPDSIPWPQMTLSKVNEILDDGELGPTRWHLTVPNYPSGVVADSIEEAIEGMKKVSQKKNWRCES